MQRSREDGFSGLIDLRGVIAATILLSIRISDAHRGDGRRCVVRADEKLTAFVELESAEVCQAKLCEALPDLTNSGSFR